MTEAKRGRPRKVQTNANETQAKTEAEAKTEAKSSCRVLKANAIHDGEGGFLPVGATFDAADAAGLKAKGLAE